MREELAQWDFVILAYGVGLVALAAVSIWAWRAMRNAEARRDRADEQDERQEAQVDRGQRRADPGQRTFGQQQPNGIDASVLRGHHQWRGGGRDWRASFSRFDCTQYCQYGDGG